MLSTFLNCLKDRSAWPVFAGLAFLIVSGCTHLQVDGGHNNDKTSTGRADTIPAQLESPISNEIVWKRTSSRGSQVIPAEAKNSNPFDGIGAEVESRTKLWLKSGLPSLTVSPPQKPSAPPLPTVVKGEFEPTTAFKERVARTEQDRAEAIRALGRNYERQVRSYNEAVIEYNEGLRGEISRRQRELPAVQTQLLSEVVADRLGYPELIDLTYDADSQRFFARLTSSKAAFNKPITVRVPLARAPAVKSVGGSVLPTIVLQLDEGQLLIKKIKVSAAGESYDAFLSDGSSAPVATMVTVHDTQFQMPELPQATPQRDIDTLILENRQHFASISNGIGVDPNLEALRRQEAENDRKMREAEAQRAAETERVRLIANIRRQEEQLRELGTGSPLSDAKGLTPLKAWTFRPASLKARDQIVVIIGNRNYGPGIPKVYYAINDAKAVRQFVEISMGVPSENIIFEIDATKGTMEGIFQSRLPNLVEKGKTEVLVYYSGHGIPTGDDARLMPADSRPDTAKITGYSRQDLMDQLGRLGAKNLTVILDACFTGTSSAGALLASAKPVFLRPVHQVALPAKTVLVTASQAEEVSWSDEASGLSLLTLHLLEGLSGEADPTGTGSIDTAKLNLYLAETVDRHARREWNQPQHPQVLGDNRILIKY